MNNGQANHGHGGEHCQDPKNTLNSDDHGVDTHKMLKLLWFSQRQIAWHSRRERRSTCCAILNATIVIEHRPDFTSTCVTSNLTPAGLSSTVFEIYANMHAFLHLFFVLAKFNRWYTHDSQDITVCLLLFYNKKKDLDALFFLVLFFQVMLFNLSPIIFCKVLLFPSGPRFYW